MTAEPGGPCSRQSGVLPVLMADYSSPKRDQDDNYGSGVP